MTDSKGYSEFVALVGQGKAILTVCRGASHFNFNFFSSVSHTSQLENDGKKIIFIGRLAHICCGFMVNDLIMWESKVKLLFPRGPSEFFLS